MSSREVAVSETESEDAEPHSRPLMNISNRNLPCRTPVGGASSASKENSNVKDKPESVKDARKRLKKEWDKLKNATRLSDDSLERKLEKDERRRRILAGVVAYVEIPNKKRTGAFEALLRAMGASVCDSFAKEVTHVVFKNGSAETIKRAKLMNVHLVSVLWVEACKNNKTVMCEKLFPVRTDSDYCHSPRVFRKFLENHSKHFEYDEDAQTVVRKTRPKDHSINLDMRNLNIGADPPIVRRADASSDVPNDSSSSVSLRLHLSTDESESPSKRSKQNVTIDETRSEAENDRSPVRRKLFTNRPLDQSFLGPGSESSQSRNSQNNRPRLPNPYGCAQTGNNKSTKRVQREKENSHPISDRGGQKLIPQMSTAVQKSRRNIDKRANMVSTFLHSQETKYLKELVARLGGFALKPSVDERTTHVVAGEPRRTVNLLKGVARGCWILDKSWMVESAVAGHWLAEEQYELVAFSRVVQRSRFQKQTFGDDFALDIFDDCGPVYVSESCAPSRRDLVDLVRLCGGKITAKTASADLVVGEKVKDKVCVSEKWILDSITCGRYKTASKYRLEA